MIRADDLRFEFAHGTGCLLDGHGERKIHAHKGGVDVFQMPHFRDVFGVAADVNAPLIDRDDVSVA